MLFADSDSARSLHAVLYAAFTIWRMLMFCAGAGAKQCLLMRHGATTHTLLLFSPAFAAKNTITLAAGFAALSYFFFFFFFFAAADMPSPADAAAVIVARRRLRLVAVACWFFRRVHMPVIA